MRLISPERASVFFLKKLVFKNLLKATLLLKMSVEINHNAVTQLYVEGELQFRRRWKELSILNCYNFPFLNKYHLLIRQQCPDPLRCDTRRRKPTTLWVVKCEMICKNTCDPAWSSQTIFHGYITASYKDEPISRYAALPPQNLPLAARGENDDHNNRFVFQKRGSGALQLAENDKYLHAGPREARTTAAPLSPTGPCRDALSPHQWTRAAKELSLSVCFDKNAAARLKVCFILLFPALLDARGRNWLIIQMREI